MPSLRAPTGVAVTLLLLTTACSGSSDQPDGSSSPSDRTDAPSARATPAPSPTEDAPTGRLQSARAALVRDDTGTFTVEVRGVPAAGSPSPQTAALPRVSGRFSFSAAAGEFRSVARQPDGRLVLRYVARGPQAWSQALFPGSPMAPDCWYEIAVPQGSVALPAQVSALLDARPVPRTGSTAAGADLPGTVLLLDALNAVGLTRVANVLPAAASEQRVAATFEVADGVDGAFIAWSVRARDLRAAVADLGPGAAVRRQVAADLGGLGGVSWRVVLDEAGTPVSVPAPPPAQVIAAGRRCTR